MASLLDSVDAESMRVLFRLANGKPGEQMQIIREALTAAFSLGAKEGQSE